MDTNGIPSLAPLAYSIKSASAASGVSRATLYRALSEKRLRAVKQGRSTLILADDLRGWLCGLPAFNAKAA